MHKAWPIRRTALFRALAAAFVAATATLSAMAGAAPGAATGSTPQASVYLDGIARTPYLGGTSLTPQAASVYLDAATLTPQASSVYLDAITLPYAPTAAPPTTAGCQTANGLACYDPDQVRDAYNLPALCARGATGKGETIMIVDAFGSPTIKADLAAFDKQFGYPAPPKFTVIAPVGAIPRFNPKNSQMAGWAGETTLDVEYAHALAPGANILLVETPASETEGVTGFPQIVAAEEYALSHYKVAVISQSFAATEETFTSYAQIAPLRAAYTDAESPHATVVAGTGAAGDALFAQHE